MPVDQIGASPMHLNPEIHDRRTAAAPNAPEGEFLQPVLPLAVADELGIPDFGNQPTFAKRQILCHHGDPATHLFRVEQGAVMVQQSLEDGRRQLVERQLCAAQEHALSLGRMTAQQRVCALLSRFAGLRPMSRFERPSDDRGFQIQLPMTRGEIGDYLGLSLETVCRTLTELQRKGVIGIGRHHGDVVIHSLKRLKRLCSACE
jgi:CRP-like cAMP-binding protein